MRTPIRVTRVINNIITNSACPQGRRFWSRHKKNLRKALLASKHSKGVAYTYNRWLMLRLNEQPEVSCSLYDLYILHNDFMKAAKTDEMRLLTQLIEELDWCL
jgi:hypothetical protein